MSATNPGPPSDMPSDVPELTARTAKPIAQDPRGFARAFYARLFARAPALRTLFPADLSAQELKLSHTLYMLVAAQEKGEAVGPALRELGRRHVGYGARPRHYRIVGEVLLETLEERNGAEWSEAAAEAWRTLYAFVIRHMKPE